MVWVGTDAPLVECDYCGEVESSVLIHEPLNLVADHFTGPCLLHPILQIWVVDYCRCLRKPQILTRLLEFTLSHFPKSRKISIAEAKEVKFILLAQVLN